MKQLVILILLSNPVVLPFEEGLTCSQQGDAYIEKIATYVDQTETRDQGWYTAKGKLVYGYYCE
jgi:hypothetical protein